MVSVMPPQEPEREFLCYDAALEEIENRRLRSPPRVDSPFDGVRVYVSTIVAASKGCLGRLDAHRNRM